MLEVRLLGKFEVRDGKKAISIPSRPAQSLFAYLVLSAGTAHRREKLAGLLWPDSLEETARDNLRHALWRIRKAFPSKLATEYFFANDLSIAFTSTPPLNIGLTRRNWKRQAWTRLIRNSRICPSAVPPIS